MPHNKILVVEDERGIRNLISRILATHGFRVHTCANGKEGLDVVETLDPDLIILDMNMPEMSGISFYHAIARVEDSRSRWPVLVLTGRERLAETFKGIDVDGFMAKPFSADQLVSEVKRILYDRFGGTTAGGDAAENGAGTDRGQASLAENRKILLLEDDPQLSALLARVLAGEGYRVCCGRSGSEGLAFLNKSEPDLIILDINMPDMSGISFYHEITVNARGTVRPPVLVMTGRAELEKTFMDVEVEGFLPKPFEMSQLLELTRSILEKNVTD